MDELRAALGADVPYLIGEPDARIHSGEAKKTKGMWPHVKTKPDEFLVAGQRVGSLEVVAAPGHTPGHMALLDTRDRSLLCGDTFTTIGGVAVTAKKLQRFPLAASATDDPAADRASARALRALDPSRLAPGHGKVVEGPAAAMDRAIANASGGGAARPDVGALLAHALRHDAGAHEQRERLEPRQRPKIDSSPAATASSATST